MKQIRISDDLDVVISEPNDTTENSFNYLVKQGRNSYSKVLRPFDNYGCYIWINGGYLDYIDKDVLDDDDFEINIVDVIKGCKTIEEILDSLGYDYCKISENIYDLIEEYASSDAYSNDDVEALRNMNEDDLAETFALGSNFYYQRFGSYHVLSLGW